MRLAVQSLQQSMQLNISISVLLAEGDCPRYQFRRGHNVKGEESQCPAIVLYRCSVSICSVVDRRRWVWDKELI
jgi:hypothetical protein